MGEIVSILRGPMIDMLIDHYLGHTSDPVFRSKLEPFVRGLLENLSDEGLKRYCNEVGHEQRVIRLFRSRTY